jgi:signal transduction histidine kinase
MLLRRRWLAIVVPVIAIGLLEIASDTLLDPYLPFPGDTIVVVAAIAVVAAILGRLAFRSIDRLAGALQARNAELERRNASIHALQAVGVAIAGLTDLDAILRTAVESARSLLDADAALLVLVGADGGTSIRASAGPVQAFEPNRSTVQHPDEGGGSADVSSFLRPDYRRSLLGAPVRVRGGSIGTLAVASASERVYGVDALEALSSMATQSGLAIENDRLQRDLRELAVRGERARIARELHDGLAQVLGYVNTKSQAAEQLIENGRVSEARLQLGELAAAARSVYVDVREAILGLAGPSGVEDGIVAALSTYGRTFAEASKVAVDVAADPVAAELRLDPVVEGEVVRIVEEALSNVRKHAAAARVDVSLRVRDRRLVVEVADDGRGIVTGAVEATTPGAWPRYGIRSMRDRAAGIAADLDVRPAPSGGTVVRLVVPIDAPTSATLGGVAPG